MGLHWRTVLRCWKGLGPMKDLELRKLVGQDRREQSNWVLLSVALPPPGGEQSNSAPSGLYPQGRSSGSSCAPEEAHRAFKHVQNQSTSSECQDQWHTAESGPAWASPWPDFPAGTPSFSIPASLVQGPSSQTRSARGPCAHILPAPTPSTLTPTPTARTALACQGPSQVHDFQGLFGNSPGHGNKARHLSPCLKLIPYKQ